MGCSTPSRVCTWGLPSGAVVAVCRARSGWAVASLTDVALPHQAVCQQRSPLHHQLEVTQIVGVHFTVDLTHQIGELTSTSLGHLHVVG